MLELLVASHLGNLKPSVDFQSPDDFPAVHLAPVILSLLKNTHSIHTAQASYPPSRPSASAVRSLRSRCRSSDCSVNRRKSSPRRRGHGSATKAETGARSILCANCQESAESAFAFPLRCTAQNSPSPSELKLVSPATSVSPHAVQWPISGSSPISRVIHNEKYVSGIHGCSTVVCSSTETSSRKTVSWGSCSGSTSSSSSAKKLSTVMRT